MSRWIAIRFAVVAIIVVANLVLAELALSMFYAVQHGGVRWFGGGGEIVSTASPEDEGLQTDDPIGVAMMLNPYYGNNTRPGLTYREMRPDLDFYLSRVRGIDYRPRYYDELSANNYGFWSYHDYPYEPAEDEYVLGIFGGSVAFHVTIAAMDERSPVLKRFAEYVAEHLDKKLVVLNFASGGVHQPQQLQMLSYFAAIGQHFDMALNLDGFNEVYVAWHNVERNGVSYAMPHAPFQISIQNVFAERAAYGAEGPVARLRTVLAEHVGAQVHSQTAVGYYVHALLRRYYSAKLDEARAALSERQEKLAYPFYLAPSTVDTYAGAEGALVKAWSDSSLLMKAISDRIGAAYVHALQPNQYDAPKAAFTDTEIKDYNVLGAEVPPLADILPGTYAKMRGRADAVANAGVRFVDLRDVFAERTDTIWIDWCCHVNDVGNHLIGEVLTDHMIAVEEVRRDGPPS